MGKKKLKSKKIQKLMEKSCDLFLNPISTAKFMENTNKELAALKERLDLIECETECPCSEATIEVVSEEERLKDIADKNAVGFAVDTEFHGDRLLVIGEKTAKGMIIDYNNHITDTFPLDKATHDEVKAHFRNVLAGTFALSSDRDYISLYNDSEKENWDLKTGKKVDTIDVDVIEVNPANSATTAKIAELLQMPPKIDTSCDHEIVVEPEEPVEEVPKKEKPARKKK